MIARLKGTLVEKTPSRIILELTETALVADPARAVKTLKRLNDAGMRIAIDDFGAGQTRQRDVEYCYVRT